MKKKSSENELKLITIINIVLMTIPFGACWMLYYAGRLDAPYYAKGNYLIIVLFLVLYAVYGHIYDATLVSISHKSELIYSQGLAAFLTDAIMYFVCLLLTKYLPAVWPLMIVFVLQLALAALWTTAAYSWHFRHFPPKRTAIVYDVCRGVEEQVREYGLDRKFCVEAVISAEECVGGLEKLDGIEAVFFCGVHSHDRNIILKHCVSNGIASYVIPRVGDVLMAGARQVHMLHLPLLRVERYKPPVEYLFVKRLLDILFSGAMLIVLLPLMLIASIAVRATDGGPVFYKQCRLTKDGREFFVLKFRSMRVDAEKDGVARLSTGDRDDRITPVGSIMRKTRIDELPQLLNILKGDMTLVGPRPERPEIAAQYEKELPEFALRLQAKAGLTGYAQVYGKYNTTPYDKLQMDLMYIAKPSILEDLRIMFATIKILFMWESTEGIAEGKSTAMEQEKKETEASADTGKDVGNPINEIAVQKESI